MSKNFWKIFLWLYFVFAIVGTFFSFVVSPIKFNENIDLSVVFMLVFYMFSLSLIVFYSYNIKVLDQKKWKFLFFLFLVVEVFVLYFGLETKIFLQIFVLFVFYKYAFRAPEIWDNSFIVEDKNTETISIFSRIFNLKKMTISLREGEVKKKEFIIYSFVLFLFFVFFILGFSSGGDYYYVDKNLELAYTGLSAVYLFSYFLFAYIANKKGDGKNFWLRVVSLSFPLGFISFLFALVWLVVNLIFFDFNILSGVINIYWRDFYFDFFINIFILYLLYKNISLISRFKKKKDE